MMNEKIKKFRQILAESGIELTIKDASDLYSMASNILKRSKRISQSDIWKMQDMQVNEMSEKEKEQAINLYQYIKENQIDVD